MLVAKQKRQRQKKQDEDRVHDQVFDLLMMLEASDYQPRVSEFHFIGNMEEIRCYADIADANRGVVVPGGIVGGSDYKHALEISECLPISRTRYEKLRLMWAAISNGTVPPCDRLCQTVATSVHTKSGAVVQQRSDYRVNTNEFENQPWQRFPTPWLTTGRKATRFTGAGLDEFMFCGTVSYKGVESSLGFAPICTAACKSLRGKFWSVSLTCEASGKALRLFTSMEGVTGFFNLRDVSESGRRLALRHWVKRHTRKLKPASTAEVSAHLRGRTEFRWFGFKGEVHIPGSIFQQS